jgi:hypothetical protein
VGRNRKEEGVVIGWKICEGWMRLGRMAIEGDEWTSTEEVRRVKSTEMDWILFHDRLK